MSIYRFISAEKARTPVSWACDVLGVRRSGYYDWATRAPSDRALTDAWLTEQIKAIWRANRRVYGAPRIHAELQLAHGIRVGRKRVERLMAAAGISGLVPPEARPDDDPGPRRPRRRRPSSSAASGPTRRTCCGSPT